MLVTATLGMSKTVELAVIGSSPVSENAAMFKWTRSVRMLCGCVGQSINSSEQETTNLGHVILVPADLLEEEVEAILQRL